MTTIVLSGNCGNSPKNQLIERLAIALTTADVRGFAEICTDDIRWHLVGNVVLEGKEAITDVLRKSAKHNPRELTIGHVLSHGRSGAVSGRVVTADGVTRDFCHVFEFSSAKGTQVQRVASYVIDAL